MHPADIHAAIRKKGWTQEAIANRLNMAPSSRSLVSNVINGRSRGYAVEACLSMITGLPLQQLFPQWYPETGVDKKIA